ncbi:MAG: IS66 family insertion sequence element accessory protein TnpB [Eubacteriales bacterium]
MGSWQLSEIPMTWILMGMQSIFFCGKRRNTIKALYFDKDGFCLVYKRLDSNGRFQWPKDASEVRALLRQEFRWLLEGLSIDQPKAIRPIVKNKKKIFYVLHNSKDFFLIFNVVSL